MGGKIEDRVNFRVRQLTPGIPTPWGEERGVRWLKLFFLKAM